MLYLGGRFRFFVMPVDGGPAGGRAISSRGVAGLEGS